MKRKYSVPKIFIVKVEPIEIICQSYGDDVNNGNGYHSGNNDYIGGGLNGNIWGSGNPD